MNIQNCSNHIARHCGSLNSTGSQPFFPLESSFRIFPYGSDIHCLGVLAFIISVFNHCIKMSFSIQIQHGLWKTNTFMYTTSPSRKCRVAI
ncbi:hypothetical protein GDO78_008689 [Eleutherodactylus coqui]|uniref:Uncharacterized protein n=1 Tax=Eleutherodactylus coqui TaxID=57060 RepID=A0A8J6KEA3_ELECQ|nr:hypothetical protein GDO78_008689 [Eleutherodactylus coqui]